jgi:hypothetical protein
MLPNDAQVQTKGHKQHLAHCSGRPQRPAHDDGADDKDVAKDEEDEEEELAEVQVSKVSCFCTGPLLVEFWCNTVCLSDAVSSVSTL